MTGSITLALPQLGASNLARSSGELTCWGALVLPPPACTSQALAAQQLAPFWGKSRRSPLQLDRMAAAVRRACGGAALSGAAAFLVARLADGHTFVDSSAISDKPPPSLTKTHNLLGRQVAVSLPSSYVEDSRARRSFDVV